MTGTSTACSRRHNAQNSRGSRTSARVYRNRRVISYVSHDEPLTVRIRMHGLFEFIPISMAVAKHPLVTLDLLFRHDASAKKGQLLWHAINSRQHDDVIQPLEALLRLGAP